MLKTCHKNTVRQDAEIRGSVVHFRLQRHCRVHYSATAMQKVRVGSLKTRDPKSCHHISSQNQGVLEDGGKFWGPALPTLEATQPRYCDSSKERDP